MQSPPPIDVPPLRTSLWRTLLRLAFIAVAVFAIHRFSTWTMAQADGLSMASWTIIAFLLLAYALLIAIPFVPGIEIGIGLLVVQGAALAPFVYLATLAGLILAFLIGHAVPYTRLHRIFADLRLRRACLMLDRVEALTPNDRLALLAQRLPRWAAPFATRFRYLTLAILINIPGNSLIGGGGGITLLAGLSRLYAPRTTALTLALAIAPVPLIVWLTGNADGWLG